MTVNAVLWNACYMGDNELVEKALQLCANKHPVTAGYSCIGIADRNGHKDTVELLKSEGAILDEHSKDPDYQWDQYELNVTLWNACFMGNNEFIKELLEKGADLHFETAGHSCIGISDRNDHMETVELLQSKGVILDEHSQYLPKEKKLKSVDDGDAWDQDEMNTCLWNACYMGDINLIEELLKEGAHLHFEISGFSCIGIADLQGHEEVVKLLKRRGAFLYPTCSYLTKAQKEDLNRKLWYACFNGDAIKVERCIDDGACIDYYQNEWSNLGIAAKNGWEDIVKILIKRDATVNSHTWKHQIAAFAGACSGGNIGCVKILHECGADVMDISSKHLWSAMHFACCEGHFEVIELLLELGLSLHSPLDVFGRTPIEYIKTSFYGYNQEVLYKRMMCVKKLEEKGIILTQREGNVSVTSKPKPPPVSPKPTSGRSRKPPLASKPEIPVKPPVLRHKENNSSKQTLRTDYNDKEVQTDNDRSTSENNIESSEICEAKKLVEQMKNRLANFETKLNELLIEKKDFTKMLEEQKQSTREEYQERLKKELQVAEIEEKLNAKTKLGHLVVSERNELQLTLDRTKQEMKQTETTLQLRLEEERKRFTQLYTEKKSLEKQVKEVATKLTVDDLYNVLLAVNDLQPQWEELGLSLGLPVQDLKEIASAHSSIARYLYEVLRHWITTIGGSWERLVGALKSSQVSRIDVANKITQANLTDSGGGICPSKKYILVKENEKCLSKDDLADIFPSVDWRVLGLLLEINDNQLERIQTNHSSESQCQEAMIIHWISTGHAYWSVLVDILKGPVLGEIDLANSLTEKHLVETKKQVVPAKPIADEILVDEFDIQKIHSEFLHVLSSTAEDFKSQPRGIIYIFGISGAAGTDIDVNNIYSTFKQEFKFAAFRRENLTCSHLATLIKAAATFEYPLSCKYKAFYFAGHGGINEDQQPYFNAVSEKYEVISVQKNVLTFFKGTHYKPSDSFMFFFDCCLSSNQKAAQERKPFAFETPVRCLVAFATSPGLASIGSSDDGGRWTSMFCHNLKQLKKGETLTSVLDKTHKAVMEFSEMSQPPQYSSCVGPIYLKGPPLEVEQSKKGFGQCRNELISLIASDDYIAVSLASVFCSDNIINKQLRAKIRQTKGKEGATLLVNNVEKAIRNKPELLAKVLDKMDEEDALHSVIMKMKGAGNDKKDQEHIVTDLYKALDQTDKKAKQLEQECKMLKEKMKQLENERKKREEEFKIRNSTITRIQTLLSQLEPWNDM